MTDAIDRRLAGILFACGCYGLYTLHYATVKWLGSSYSLWQLIFVRSVIMFGITLALNRGGAVREAIASPHKVQTALRATLQFVSALCFYFAAASMSLPTVTTIYSAAPLMVVVLSIFLLAERVNGYAWIAILVGLAGTVIAADPGGEINAWSAIAALASAFFWALTVTLTRKSGARESTSVQMVITGIVFIVLSGGFMSWHTPTTPTDWLLISLLGVQIYLAQYFFFEACRLAPASLIGPMEYSSVAWSCILGYLIFADIPTWQTVLGAVLVVGSGVALAIGTHKAPPASQPN